MKIKRGDTVRIVVAGAKMIGRVVAEIENAKRKQFRILASNGKVYDREPRGISLAEDGDREKLTAILSEK